MPKPIKARTVRKTTSGRNSGRGSSVTYDRSANQPKSADATKYHTFATPKSQPNNRPAGVSGASQIRAMKSAVEIRKANSANASSKRRNKK